MRLPLLRPHHSFWSPACSLPTPGPQSKTVHGEYVLYTSIDPLEKQAALAKVVRMVGR